MANNFLQDAKNKKNDEFYTQFNDIQNEINAYIEYDKNVFRDKVILLPCDDPEWSNFTRVFVLNFEEYGIKKLISTSFANESKNVNWEWTPTLFETSDPQYDIKKTKCKGKIFTLDRNENSTEPVSIDNLKWKYLEGTGDFRSEEVKQLRDEADIIITNPPFSLFREFLSWIIEGKKDFLILGSQNAITYKEVFPLIKENKIWLGHALSYIAFKVPPYYEEKSTRFWIDKTGQKWRSMGNICWFTNIEHGNRHIALELMETKDLIRHSKHKEIRNVGYQHYDNYNAIEVPYVDSIPSDYDGVMGVPITFLDKYCPDQFEILGASESEGKGFSNGLWDSSSKVSQPLVNGEKVYKRIFIRKRK